MYKYFLVILLFVGFTIYVTAGRSKDHYYWYHTNAIGTLEEMCAWSLDC